MRCIFVETRSLDCWDRLSSYLGGYRTVLLKPEDKPAAQQAIATAISNANRKH